jgi:fluoroacetyl-CoA thioesterase
LCTLEASVGDRLIATGRTGQKILKRNKIGQLLKQP